MATTGAEEERLPQGERTDLAWLGCAHRSYKEGKTMNEQMLSAREKIWITKKKDADWNKENRHVVRGRDREIEPMTEREKEVSPMSFLVPVTFHFQPGKVCSYQPDLLFP